MSSWVGQSIQVMRCTLRRLADIMALWQPSQEMINPLMWMYFHFFTITNLFPQYQRLRSIYVSLKDLDLTQKSED